MRDGETFKMSEGRLFNEEILRLKSAGVRGVRMARPGTTSTFQVHRYCNFVVFKVKEQRTTDGFSVA